MSSTENEVLALTKLKTRAKEGRQAYLKRLLNGLDTLYNDDNPDADQNWEKATDAVQKWYTAAAAADENSKTIPDFTNGKAGDTPLEDAIAASGTKAAKANGKVAEAKPAKAAAKPKEDAKPAKAAKVKEPKVAKAPKAGKVTKIQAIAFSNPKKGVDELTEMLKEKGIDTSRATVWSVRTALMRDVGFLHGKGLLKDNPFA